MEVILLENFNKLGKVGDIVNVKDGYAQNYLIPKKKVLKATKANKEFFEQQKVYIEKRNQELQTYAEVVQKKIDNLECLSIKNAAENGHLYGSVKSSDIIDAIHNVYREITISKDSINLSDPIKYLGVYPIEITLYHDIKATILLNIAANKENAINQMEQYKVSLNEQNN